MLAWLAQADGRIGRSRQNARTAAGASSPLRDDDGSARCAGCSGSGPQADVQTCALCGGNGRCQHCTNGVMHAGERAVARRRGTYDLALASTILVGVAALGWSGAARAQSLPSYQPIGATYGPPNQFGGFSGFSGFSSTSSDERVVFNAPTVTTTNVTAYSTQIIGRINGGTPLYDLTVPVPYADPAAQAGVVAARAAITMAGGPGVIIGAPVRTASSMTTTSATSTLYNLVGTSQAISTDYYIGGNGTTAQIGTRSRCTGLSALPSSQAPSCGVVAPTASFTTSVTPDGRQRQINYQSAPGNSTVTFSDPTPILVNVTGHTELFNVNVITTDTIGQATNTTNTTTLFEQYTLFGTVQAFGMVHTAVQSGALDANSRFLRRLGDEAVGGAETPYHTWIEGYGMWSRSKAQGGLSGDNRNQYGIAGGISAIVTPNFTLGVGIDHGNTDITLDSAFAESGKIDLTQLGVNAGFTSGPWFANLAATYGFGSADTQNDLLGRTTANYHLTTAGVLGEAGYRMRWGDWRVTPSLGFDHTTVRSGGFTETGALALTAPVHTTDRTRVWAGLDVGQRLGNLDWSVYGRVVGVVAGDERLLPVTFYGLPMTVTGVSEAKVGGDAGARVSYKFVPSAELVARYDGRFRDGFTAHAATAGLKVSF